MSDGTIVIEPVVVRNKAGAGWLPLCYVNGKNGGSDYATHGYNKDEAERLAIAFVRIECARWVGDWNIKICPLTYKETS